MIAKSLKFCGYQRAAAELQTQQSVRKVFILLIALVFYYSVFVREKKVINSKFLKVVDNGQTLQINTTESSKYIKNYLVKDINDTTVQIDVFTTTIYNPLATRKSEINIDLDKKIKTIKIAEREIKRDSLSN